MACQQPQAHPDRCGCPPSGVEQLSSAWLAQLRDEYRQFGDENRRLQQRCRELEEERAALQKTVDSYAKHSSGIHALAEIERLRAEVERLRPPSGHAPYPEQIKAWQEASRQDLARCARMSACIDQLTSTLEDIRSQLDAGLMPSIGAIDKALEDSG